MKESDQINLLKKQISVLESDLDIKSSQLGETIYDSQIIIDGIDLYKEIDELEERIPEIKKQMETFKSYTLSILEAKEELKECTLELKKLDPSLGSIYEKVGVELFCFIGEKELSNEKISIIYKELKDGELKSETLENRLYSYENSAQKKGVLNIFSKPFKVHSIKKDIRINNKLSLKKFRELGKIYTEIPDLISEETNESLLDVFEEYKKLDKNIIRLNDKIKSLQNRISDKEEKIKDGCNGLKLNDLYKKFEDEIIEIQNSITEKMKLLGYQVLDMGTLKESNNIIDEKLIVLKGITAEIDHNNKKLNYYEKKVKFNILDKEVKDREERIKIEETHIESLKKKLESHIIELKEVNKTKEELSNWLSENDVLS